MSGGADGVPGLQHSARGSDRLGIRSTVGGFAREGVPMKFNESFPVLSTVAIVLIVVGWIVIAVGGLRLLGADDGSIAEMIQVSSDKSDWGTDDWAGLAMSIGLVVVGLFNVALGEIIGVLFAIEKNTAEAARYLVATASGVKRLSVPATGSPAPTATTPAPIATATAPPPRTLLAVRQCPQCGREWEYGDECPDCGISLTP